ncbi:Mov34/MPN/PAD-1 family protein [Sorangium sp. So ce1000]|uniref:Mov34/MPN/PAD-1 family protein n=1 Tax=Sorangium sp. So ce1000 TaxID=3133325 RepID=UPI003F6235C0
MHSTWRSACGAYTVRIGLRCIRTIAKMARQHYPNEVGTSLVGTYSDDGSTATVNRIAPLARDSRGGRMNFVRGAAGLTEFFSRLFDKSRGRAHYVGDWHSHPNGAPIPSSTDWETTRAFACNPKALCPECLLVVVSVTPAVVELGVYVYSATQGRVILHRVQ